MIGTEKRTEALSAKERELVPLIAQPLRAKIGEANAVTSGVIISGMQRVYGIKITPARLRKIINFIRLKGVVRRLVASGKGYYIEKDDTLYEIYINQLEERASAILAVAKQLKKQKNEGSIFENQR